MYTLEECYIRGIQKFRKFGLRALPDNAVPETLLLIGSDDPLNFWYITFSDFTPILFVNLLGLYSRPGWYTFVQVT